ncbi:hypothetical protein [Pedosphaera parvula]|nr:hypothetical protein [Pedosphaera parvula]
MMMNLFIVALTCAEIWGYYSHGDVNGPGQKAYKAYAKLHLKGGELLQGRLAYVEKDLKIACYNIFPVHAAAMGLNVVLGFWLYRNNQKAS